MNKEQVLELIKSSYNFPKEILDNIEYALKDYMEYNIDNKLGILNIESGPKGSMEPKVSVKIEANQEDNTLSVVIISQDLNKTNEIREFGFRQTVGLDVFTDAKSYVINKDGLILYKGSFVDDNKYYEVPDFENVKLEDTEKAYSDTTPVFEKGVLQHGPKSSYQPFTSQWQRYNTTRLVKKSGRTPIHGEYSDICLTFDDSRSIDDVKLMQESYGTLYRKGEELKTDNLDEIAAVAEEIANRHTSGEEFDGFGFEQEFREAMFGSRSLN